MESIKLREYKKFGDRVLAGGDLYSSQQKFHNKVLARTDEHTAEQMQYISCPVLELDATLSLSDIINAILVKLNLMPIADKISSTYGYCQL